MTTQELIYFKGHAKATFMSDGATVEDSVRAIEDATYKNKAEVDAQLTELSAKVNELDKGEAYIIGDTLTFRNYADASIEGETLKL